MFELSKEFKFEASHQLMHHDGKCARLHGHSWVGRVILRGHDLKRTGPKENMLMDFSDISSVIKELVDTRLDHYHLNDTLDTDMPTSEYVAQYVYFALAPALPMLYAVEIKETCTSSCTYIGPR